MTQKQVEMQLLAENSDNKMKKYYEKSVIAPVLLDLVEKHPVIYDPDDPNYGQVDSLNIAWAVIATEMNVNGLFLL